MKKTSVLLLLLFALLPLLHAGSQEDDMICTNRLCSMSLCQLDDCKSYCASSYKSGFGECPLKHPNCCECSWLC
ncbi:hypothetical protein ZOSMA_22G00600 [Zostera marina]|uniref:Uncharacterized protein n=1 Tax=Zostera marina TaxID=29655 RepID=A0A0K9PIK1_ZOSMR|nr:hypothetical protein ZOSMA_22G00600 [Zostera marina]